MAKKRKIKFPEYDEKRHLIPRDNVILKNDGIWQNRLLIGTPSTGLVRMEWVLSRYGQVIPVNWSATDAIQWISTFAPMQYLVADAQNLICRTIVEKNFQWLLLIESDNLLPPDAFLRINAYIREATIPVMSGLYFTKSDPAEPLLFRGRGTSYYTNWKMGDKVWVDGVPTGFLLVHGDLIRAMWKESAEYVINGQSTRRIFDCPEKVWYDPESGATHGLIGTSDLAWCERVIKEKFFEKSGWKEFQKKEFPFLVDTNIFVRHIDESGRQFPLQNPKELGF